MTNEELTARIQAGETELILTLWFQTERFIKMMARKWQRYAETEDLVQEGFLILSAAAADFDEREGGPFITYLGQRLRWEWTRWLEETGTSVRFPSYLHQAIMQYERFIASYSAEYGREPSDITAARELAVSLEQLHRIREAAARKKIRSLNELVAEDQETELIDTIAERSDFTTAILDDVYQGELAAVLWPIVDDLESNQAVVIRQRYREHKTLKECSEELGLSVARIGQIEKAALRELRKPSRAKKLRPFLSDEECYSRGIKGTDTGTFQKTWTSATERTALQRLGAW